MSEYNMHKLKIDDEFKSLISPLTHEERVQLEENIVKDGCREPLCVWNKKILDGHNRYEICTRLQLPFKITYIYIRSRAEAIAWICANQLGRRNITDETRRFLIGKRYEMEKIVGAHNAVGTNQYTRKAVRSKKYTEPLFDDTACRTRERLGKEYHISPATIAKYGSYSQSIDALSKVEPKLVSKILSGRVKISQENVVDLSRLLPADVQRISTDLLEGNITYSESRNILPKKKNIEKHDFPLSTIGSVKDMPVYDPDAEILSLVLTVPSWVSSINRTHTSAKLKEISSNARHRLLDALINLKSAIDTLLTAFKEEN